MTPLQARKVEWLKRELIQLYHSNNTDYEYKTFDVTELDWGHVEVIAEEGLVNDEGTMAEVFARHRWQIFIGPRGGMRARGKGIRKGMRREYRGWQVKYANW